MVGTLVAAHTMYNGRYLSGSHGLSLCLLCLETQFLLEQSVFYHHFIELIVLYIVEIQGILSYVP